MKHIFFDERGDNGLDFSKSGTSPYFLVTSIIIDDTDAPRLREALDNVSKLNFGGGPIKSRTVADNHAKRKKIITQLEDLRWFSYTLIVDKKLLYSPGFKNVTVFYKYMNNRVYSYLTQAFPDSLIIADRHGSSEFMLSFIDYVRKKNKWDLFNDRSITFVESNDERLVQLADFIAGTIGKEIETKKGFLNHSRIVIDNWPKLNVSLSEVSLNTDNKVDIIIAQNAVQAAERFISRNLYHNEPRILDQCNFLRLLLQRFRYDDPYKYVSCSEIRKFISTARGVDTINSYYLRTNVIGKIRDSRVLIASNRTGGYKIPVGLKDISDYIININDKVYPMLDRLNTYRKHIKVLTEGAIDILDDSKYKHLQLQFYETENSKAHLTPVEVSTN